MENYYEVLGVEENATQEEIKKAFRNKSKEYHPDRGGDEEVFKKINEAYTTLSDEDKRKVYDGQKNNPFADFGFNMDGGNPFDMFSNMFGGRQEHRAPDKIVNLKVGAVDSFLGKRIEINFNRKTSCEPCKGKGGERVTCKVCNGNGYIVQRVGNAFFQNIVQTACGSCNTKGFTFSSKCKLCNGEGRVNDTQNVSINLPVGISDGQLIRAQGMGDYQDGTFGDLIFKVQVVAQDGFEKMNGDLIYNKFMTLDEFNKDEISVPHPNGDLIIKMPKIVDTSSPLKVAFKGYQNEKGDFYVKLFVKHTRL